MDLTTKPPKPLSNESAEHAQLSKIDPDAIGQLLTAKYCGRKIDCLFEVESTNTEAAKLAKNESPTGTLVLCQNQTAGRGRRGKQWISEPHESVCMSLILRPHIHSCLAGRYTIATALSVCDMLSDYGIERARIKWPNDVLVNGKKISGILLDCAVDGKYVDYLVVGIGLNVNTVRFAGDIADIATSIYQVLGRTVSRNRVIAKLLNSAEPLFDMCESDDGFAKLMQRYVELSAVINNPVGISGVDGVIEGTAIGFDDMGRIILQLKNGLTRVFDTGDVSLRIK